MTIQEMILESMERRSDKVAIISDGYAISYAELLEKAFLINSFLQKNYNAQIIIPLLFALPDHYIYGIIGALFSKNIFMPLDSAYPTGRILEYIESSSCGLLLTDKKMKPGIIQAIENSGIEIIYLEDIFNGRSTPVYGIIEAHESDAIYLYFTSGSTGEPKGILGKNESLAHFINWEIKEFGVSERDIFPQLTSPSFDPYLRDIFVPICAGAKIRLVNRSIILISRLFNGFLHDNKITFMHTTPSILNILISSVYVPDYYKRLRHILIAGEQLPPELVVAWYKSYGNHTQLVNLYGSTETTLAKVFARIPHDFSDEIVPVGKPISDTKIYVMNKDASTECNVGDVGEVYIETDYMTHGYYGDKDNSSFGINENKGKRYATGDLGFIKNDDLYLMGRKDDQRKIGGVRIDLNEISRKILMSDSAIKDCAVIYADNLLIAFYTSPNDCDIRTIRAFLETRLLPIHIPHIFHKVVRVPINTNGKVDKAKLFEQYKKTR